MRELDEALEVAHRRIAPNAVLVHERWPGDVREDHVVAADRDAALRVAGAQLEALRRQRDLLEHKVGVEPYDAVLAHRLPRLAEQPLGLRVVEAHAASLMRRRQPRSIVAIASSERIS